MERVLVVLAVCAVAAVVALVAARRTMRRPVAAITRLADDTSVESDGAVRSIQAADLVLPEPELDAIWSPMHLERLARTYWRFLTRVTLGLIRIAYTPSERMIVLVTRPFVLLRFRAPEYELDGARGLVRWRIRSGLLVSRHGHDRDGYLQIEVSRGSHPSPGEVAVHVEVTVANFYPSIASTVGRPIYKATQSRIHVIVTNSFLRSLARLDLARSRVRQFEFADQP